uniref:DUF2147 domain-containing protein n=1 Tax=Fundidesulfovibrio putealis TaxID=270496 RepID=A0A7C4AIC7_9BACT
MKRLALFAILFAVLSGGAALFSGPGASLAQAGVDPSQANGAKPDAPKLDLTGLWKADFMGNRIECHLEQRGDFLYGLAYVYNRSGERITYHLAGVVSGDRVRAMHGSGHVFDGTLQGPDAASGTFTFKDGPSFSMQAQRTAHGKTAPGGGLNWPAGFGPAQ